MDELALQKIRENELNDRCYGKFNREDHEHILMQEAEESERKRPRRKSGPFLIEFNLHHRFYDDGEDYE